MTQYHSSQIYLMTAHEPEDLAVSLEEMKLHLRADFDDQDDLIVSLVQAVTNSLEGPDGILGRTLMDQVWQLKLPCFPCDYIEIPLPPLVEVQAITYIDNNGDEQSFDLDDCHVTGERGSKCGRIYLKQGVSWPTTGSGHPEPITVQFRAGYVDTANSPATNNLPKAITAAIKLTVGTLYESREDAVVGTIVNKLPGPAAALLDTFKVYR